MSKEDLENMGVLLPEEQWGKHTLATTVNKPLLIAIGVMTMISVVLMYWGNGNFLTWLGVALFLTMLSGFTLLSIKAVEKQRRESDRVKRRLSSEKR
jgi:hypothetical protein